MSPDSSEERLLRLIKGEGKKKTDAKQTGSLMKISLFSEFIKKVLLKNKIFKSSFVKSINKILTVFLLISLGYLTYNILFETQEDITSLIQQREIPYSPANDIEIKKELVLPEIKDFSVYTKEIGRKQLFSAPFVEEPEAELLDIDISKKFNLVGIIAGVEPQAIIEDKELQKTYYLYKGQSFNGAILEEIGDGRVILNYKGKKITLVL